MLRFGAVIWVMASFGNAVMVRLVKACLVPACLGLAVMLRSGPLIWVMASCGQAVKFRQGPFGSVELRRVGSRRFWCGKVR